MPLSPIDILETVSPPGSAADAAALLAGVLDSAMDAIITVDEQQLILLYNVAAEKVFGWPRQQILGQPLERLIPQRFRAAHAQHVGRFGTTGVTSRRMGARNVIYGLRADGHEFPLDASISQLDTPGGKLCTVVLRDIGQRLEAEEQHARLAARLAAILDSAMDAIISVDEAQTIVMYNRAAERIFGWPSDQVLGQPLARLMPARYRAGHGQHVARFALTGVTSRRMGDQTVIFGLRANGEEFPMDTSISQLVSAEGRLFTVILRDVTERVRSQQERSAFAAAAHSIREEEKSRVARELHDELAQSLTALKMDTNWVFDNVAVAPQQAQQKLAEMMVLIDGAVASTRRIASDLRPLLLDDLGLAPAIEWLAGNFTQRHGVACKLSVAEDLELQEPYATAVFRMVQESLGNVAKHASAAQADVRVELREGEIVLEVRDDGKGFDVAAPRRPGSLGLMGLHERAELLQGTVTLTSSPGAGTRVEIRMPLPGLKAAP
ncbi:MAG: PAS domain S-box protein [Ramlibacter sp.]|nr:PAS domain S-box protein [Ramlibacter sp.]